MCVYKKRIKKKNIYIARNYVTIIRFNKFQGKFEKVDNKRNSYRIFFLIAIT